MMGIKANTSEKYVAITAPNTNTEVVPETLGTKGKAEAKFDVAVTKKTKLGGSKRRSMSASSNRGHVGLPGEAATPAEIAKKPKVRGTAFSTGRKVNHRFAEGGDRVIVKRKPRNYPKY